MFDEIPGLEPEAAVAPLPQSASAALLADLVSQALGEVNAPPSTRVAVEPDAMAPAPPEPRSARRRRALADSETPLPQGAEVAASLLPPGLPGFSESSLLVEAFLLEPEPESEPAAVAAVESFHIPLLAEEVPEDDFDSGAPRSVEQVQVRGSEASADDYQRSTTEDQLRDDDFSLPEALLKMLELKGSDLHLSSGAPPIIRIDGSLRPIPDAEPLSPKVIRRVMYAICTQQQRERFEEGLELDFSYSLAGVARFRVNIYQQRESVGAAFRVIPFEIKTLEQLGMPPVIANFASLPRGFVLVTGPTGSGKSTTLAAMVDMANKSRHEHIMTVEDPIEFLHQHKNCLVNQREVGMDTLSFSNALKHVLRQDPDIILVGEMRDLETISVALTAAETGHLVFATLHTQDAAQTIDRVIDVFPPSQQQQIRQQLAGTLQGIVCQTLCKSATGRGRVAATEVLVATPAIRNLIREGKTHQIYSALQAGASFGMHTLDQNLAELVRGGKISLDTGYEKCHHVEDFSRLAGKPAPRR